MNQSTGKRLCVLGLSLLCTLWATGCGDASEPPPEKPSATPPASAPEAALSGKPITELPSEFPAYPGAQVSQVGGRGKMLSAVLQTSDAPEKVLAYYLETLPSDGWSAQESSIGKEHTVMADKEGRFLTVMASPEGGKTKIGILLVER